MFHHFIILPTMGCNCRCPYCYEDHEAVNMSDGVYESIKRFLIIQKNKELSNRQENASHSIPWYRIEYFGGEPLLCLDKVLELSAFAKDLFSDAFIGSMTTNATRLNSEAFEKINAVGIRTFHITLDGPKALHDTRRVFADGSGTFDVIWKNLMYMHQSDLPFEVHLRLHITPESLEIVKDFSHNELSALLVDDRFNFYYHPLSPLGGKHDDEFNMYSREEGDDILEQLDNQTTYKIPGMCYAADPHSIVILPNGDLCKCTVTLGQSVVGKLLPNGTVDIDNELFSTWCIPYLYPEKRIKCPKNDVPELKKWLQMF